MTELVPIQSDSEILRLSHLACEIWNEYFPAIIGQAQVDYMVEKFQSAYAIREQLAHGYLYYFIRHAQRITGYTGLYPDIAANTLQLSKFYIHREYRGCGIGTETLALIQGLAQSQRLDKIRLTVNRHNTPSIQAYEHMGFSHCGTLARDIGNGFIMDDYIMEKPVQGLESSSPDHPD